MSVGWVEEHRSVGVRVSVSEREASRREGADRKGTQYLILVYVGFHWCLTKPTLRDFITSNNPNLI